MSVEELVEALRQRGLRITPQRTALLRLLLDMSHPTAERLLARLREQFPWVSQATVYNTLKTLREAGLVKELAYGRGTHRYELAGGGHGHLLCERCEGLFDIEAEAPEWLRQLPKRHGGFRIDAYRLELTGICPGCLDEATDSGK